MHPTDKAARIAGAVFLFMSVFAIFGLIYVPGKLIVRGNATATVENILNHETLFSLAIISELFSKVIFIWLGFALYRLLSDVNKTWAQLMVAFVLVSAALGFVSALNNIAALTLFRGADFLSVFDKPQRDALGVMFIRLHGRGQIINEILLGAYIFPFGLLVFRSGFLPRFLGVWVIVNGFAWLPLSITALIFPLYYDVAFRIAVPILLGEVVTFLWLLIRGAKVSPSAIAAA